MIIGIIGAQGNFGSKLEKRLGEIKPSDVEILGTKNRDDTKEIIETSDVLILTVPQLNSTELFEQINSYAKKEVLMISFLAHFPIEKVSTGAGRKVIRAMTDPWFNFSSFIKNDNSNYLPLDFFFNNIAKAPPLYFTKDEEIDLFTIHFCYLFVVLLLHKQGALDPVNDHLEYISNAFNIPKDKLTAYTPEGNPKELLTLLATKGGITEMIHYLFTQNTNITPEEIIKETSKKFI